MGEDVLVVISSDFILNDPRFRKLGTAGKVLYLALLATTFKNLQRALPKDYDLHEMVRDSGVARKSVTKWLERLKQPPHELLRELEDGSLEVYIPTGG